MWILSESGRFAEAKHAARDALPVMRRMPKFRLEGCAYMLWRLGRPEAAARVLGALAGRRRAGRELSTGNYDRIGQDTLAELEAMLSPHALSTEMALGEHISESAVCALLAEAVTTDAPTTFASG